MARTKNMLVVLVMLAALAGCAAQPFEVPVISTSGDLPALEGESGGGMTLADLLAIPPQTPLALYTQEGGIVATSAEAQVKARRGELTYQGQALLGIVQDPPSFYTTAAYSWALEQVEGGERALVILIDGLGYGVYSRALAEGIIPNLAQGEGEVALAVYRPVTNAGLAAIVTGQTPDKSGIHDRSNRQPQTPDILGILAGKGRRGILVEGAINILDLDGEVSLNSDMNGDGFSDDEIHASALARIREGYDYMLVHYHSLDDAGHDYGPWASEAQERLAVLDQDVGELLAAWPGPVLVVADHGMHATADGGSHGDFCHEDMLVPLITFPGR